MTKGSIAPGRKAIRLRRKKYCFDLKFDRPLGHAIRRGNRSVKKGRAKFYEYENKFFNSKANYCAIDTRYRIMCVN